MQEAGAPPLPDLEFMHDSPYLNLYVYPREVDYSRERPLDRDLAPARVVRAHAPTSAFEVPAQLRDGHGGADLPLARLARLGRRRR